jgi:hypothetical protein
MAGVFSLCLILLVAVGPMWLADRLEHVETAREGIRSAEEIISEGNTTTSFTPYKQLNNDTKGHRYVYDSLWSEYVLRSSNPYPLDVIYDVDGFFDGISGQPVTTDDSKVFIFFDIHPNEMLSNGVYNISFRYHGNWNLRVGTYCSWLYTDGDDSVVGSEDLRSYIEGGRLDYKDNHHLWIQFTHSELNDMASIMSDYDTDHTPIGIAWECDSQDYDGSMLYFSIEAGTGYYEETTTTYDNTTVTTYEPYIQTFTPYLVHKWGMALGGILVVLTALIVSPLPIGESFDSFFPINNFSTSNRKRTNYRKYKNKRRR